jgi:lipopolysaccharide transport system permease protein
MKKRIESIHFTAKKLAIRDVKSEFKQSFIGVAWLFITPLINTVLWLLISQSGLMNQSGLYENLGLYIFSGTLMWQTFVESFNMVLNQVNANKSILSKINFEREALILSGLYKQLIHTSIRYILLLVLILISIDNAVGSIQTYLYPLLGFILLILSGFALGLILLPFTFLFSDLNKLTQYGLQLWMYISPVVFIKPKTGLLSTLFDFNFLSIPLTIGRQSFYSIGFISSTICFSYLFLGAAVFVLGIILFRVTMPIIIERMSN